MPRIADFRAFYRIFGRGLFASVFGILSFVCLGYGEAVHPDEPSHTVIYSCNFSSDNSYTHSRPTPRPVNYTVDNLTITGTCSSGQTCNVDVGLQNGPLSSQCSAPGRQFDHWECMHSGVPINCVQTGIGSNCTYGVTFAIPQNDNCSSNMAHVYCYVAWKKFKLTYDCGGGSGSAPSSDYEPFSVEAGQSSGLEPLLLKPNSCNAPVNSDASFAGWYCSMSGIADSNVTNVAGVYDAGSEFPIVGGNGKIWLNNATCTAVWKGPSQCAEGQSRTQTLLNGLTGVETSSNGTLPLSPYENELYVSFSYNNTPVNVYVQGMCSATSAATQGTIGDPSTDEGVNCWCRVWGYNNGTNFVPVYNTMWVYNNSNYTDNENCYDLCPSECRRVLQGEKRMRDGLYATFGCVATEIVLKWLDFYGNNFNNPQSCLFGTNGGITPILDPEIIRGYDFVGWYIQSTSSGEQS